MSSDEQLWSTGDVGRRLRITAERARQLSHRENFPSPAVAHGKTRLWRISDVEAWISEHRPEHAA